MFSYSRPELTNFAYLFFTLAFGNEVLLAKVFCNLREGELYPLSESFFLNHHQSLYLCSKLYVILKHASKVIGLLSSMNAARISLLGSKVETYPTPKTVAGSPPAIPPPRKRKQNTVPWKEMAKYG